jgi:hypothetical protein
MTTKQKLIDDIKLRIQRGNPSSEFNVPNAQISHQLDITRDQLLAQFLETTAKNHQFLSPTILEREFLQPVVDTNDTVNEKYKITLTHYPLDSNQDKAISILTDEGLPVSKNSPYLIAMLRHLRWAIPNPKTVVGTRLGRDVILQGAPDRMRDSEEFEVVYVRSYTQSPVTDTEEFKIEPSLVGLLTEAVEQIVRREMFGIDDYVQDEQTEQNQTTQKANE